MRRTFFLLALMAVSGAMAADTLPRRAYFGTPLIPLDSATRAASGVPMDGIMLGAPAAGSPAESAGLLEGDILLSIDDRAIRDYTDVGKVVKETGSNKKIRCEIVRAGQRLTVSVTLKELPRESSTEYEVIYDAVDVAGELRRIILTKPHGEGKRPLFVLLGSIGCYSLDPARGMYAGYAQIVQEMTRAGFVTLRIEKSGMGDSRGKPCGEQNFWDEVNGVKAALAQVRGYDYIDSNRIMLFGHSTGASVAPVVAHDIPVAGIVGVSTVASDWTEYELGNLRRQRLLGGADYDSVEAITKLKVQVMNRLVWQGQSAEEISAALPGAEILLGYPVHNTFIRDLARLNIAKYWMNYDGRALFVSGTSDFITQEENARYAAELVNRYHAGYAEYASIDKLDYFLLKTGDQKKSFDNMMAGLPELEFNTEVVEKIRAWCVDVAGLK